MTTRLHILDAAKRIPDDLCAALAVDLAAAIEIVSAKLPMEPVDVCLIPDPKSCLPEQGLGGFTVSDSLVHIFCDPASEHLHGSQRAMNIAAIVAHELHHATRFQGPGYGETLGKALFTEGLAQVFEHEVTCVVPLYATALSDVVLSAIEVRAKKTADQSDYRHERWFFGDDGDADFPRHGGYSLGYALARCWLSNRQMTSALAVHTDAREFLNEWRAGKISAELS